MNQPTTLFLHNNHIESAASKSVASRNAPSQVPRNANKLKRCGIRAEMARHHKYMLCHCKIINFEK
jgi:hypothetical protein